MNLEDQLTSLELIQRLEGLGEGKFHCGWLEGWIQIEELENSWEVMWCDGKNTHSNFNGPAVSVEFLKDESIGEVYKSAISMWPVIDEEEKINWAEFIKEKIEQAYKKNNK